jgi:hypothetical protein
MLGGLNYEACVQVHGAEGLRKMGVGLTRGVLLWKQLEKIRIGMDDARA